MKQKQQGHGAGPLSFQQTVLFAQQAHSGQKDKLGRDYAEHPITVAEIVRNSLVFNQKYRSGDITTVAETAALLHDVLEDTDVTVEELSATFPKEVVDVVVLLTKAKGVTYPRFISNIIASENRDAMLVKMADIMHNSCVSRMSFLPLAVQSRLLEKYQGAMVRLESALLA